MAHPWAVGTPASTSPRRIADNGASAEQECVRCDRRGRELERITGGEAGAFFRSDTYFFTGSVAKTTMDFLREHKEFRERCCARFRQEILLAMQMPRTESIPAEAKEVLLTQFSANVERLQLEEPTRLMQDILMAAFAEAFSHVLASAKHSPFAVSMKSIYYDFSERLRAYSEQATHPTRDA